MQSGQVSAVGAFTLAPTIPVANAYPVPSVYPVSWELDFSFDLPKRIVVEIPGGAAPKAYWYMTYIATNNTAEIMARRKETISILRMH